MTKKGETLENKAVDRKPLVFRKIDLAEALKLRLVNKLTYGEIAKRFGCHKSAVHGALSRFTKILKEPGEIEAYSKYKADLLNSAELTMLEKVMDTETIEKASLNNAAYAFAQLHNAGRLERGKSTSNVDMRQLTMSLQELQEEQRRLEKELETSNA
ncbi:hypothetical protein [Candidatus Kuenenia sp.]|uniref:hypothetical protein n=1 Tax=Candidatus Kuenenia sp. TaxID=2499824 RepID=UPI00322095F3